MKQVRLTDREHQVLNHMLAGLSNEQIGNAMGIARGTVHAHLANIGHKVGLSGRNLAIWAARQPVSIERRGAA